MSGHAAQHVPSLQAELQPLPDRSQSRIGRSRAPVPVAAAIAAACFRHVCAGARWQSTQGKVVNVRRHGEEQALGLVVKGLSRLATRTNTASTAPSLCNAMATVGQSQTIRRSKTALSSRNAVRADPGRAGPATHPTGGQRHHFSRVSGTDRSTRTASLPGAPPPRRRERTARLIRLLRSRDCKRSALPCFPALDAPSSTHSDVLHHHHALRNVALLRRRQPPDLQVDPGAGSIAL